MIATSTPAMIELQRLPIWVCWNLERQNPADSKPTKIPRDPRTGYRAKSNDPSTWGNYVAAQAAQQQCGYAGNGVMIAAPYFYADLDHCRDRDTGEIHPDALAIIRSFNTYAEVSQSLSGVKLIGRCDKFPADTGKNFRPRAGKLNCPANRTVTWGPNGGIEIYGAKPRLFCFTGLHLAGTPDTINDAGGALQALYRRLMPPPTWTAPVRRSAGDIDDNAKLKRCLAYTSKMPRAISGAGGHSATFAIACVCVRFDLNESDSMVVLRTFNATLEEKWSDDDLAHKLNDARERAGGERGNHLRESRPPRFLGVFGRAHAIA